MKQKGGEMELNVEEFERVCGVGVVVSEEDIKRIVAKVFEENKEEIMKKEHMFQFNKLLYKVKEELKWADQKKVIDEVNSQKLALIGEPPADDGTRKKRGKATKEEKDQKKKKEEDAKNEESKQET